MDRQDIDTLYAYNRWATARTLQAAEAVTPEQFQKDLGNSFPSVRDTLAHIVNVEWLWLRRWQGESPTRVVPASDYPSVAKLREGFAGVDADRQRFLAGIPDAQLAATFTWRDMQGVERRLPLIQTLQHVVNHGTYHRGQVTTMLRQLGATPVSTDLYRFYVEVQG
jgi:uncharacterized damage-inducible protein DinB